MSMSDPRLVSGDKKENNEMLIRKEAVERETLGKGNEFGFLYPSLYVLHSKCNRQNQYRCL